MKCFVLSCDGSSGVDEEASHELFSAKHRPSPELEPESATILYNVECHSTTDRLMQSPIVFNSWLFLYICFIELGSRKSNAEQCETRQQSTEQ